MFLKLFQTNSHCILHSNWKNMSLNTNLQTNLEQLLFTIFPNIFHVTIFISYNSLYLVITFLLKFTIHSNSNWKNISLNTNLVRNLEQLLLTIFSITFFVYIHFLTHFHPLWKLRKQFLSWVRQRNTAHLEHLVLTMPLHPGILHLPFSLSCKGQWSVLSLLTGSGGTKLGGPFFFFPRTTTCEGLPFLLCDTLFSRHKQEATWTLKSNSDSRVLSRKWDWWSLR